MVPEEKGEELIDTTPEREAATVLDSPATVLASQVLEEADVTSAPMTEEPQVEDDATQDLNPSHDSQITVENVASEIEEAVEECQKEDTAMLVVTEEVLALHKEAATLDKVGEATQIEVTDERSEERVIQHEVSLSRRATSEGGEAGKTGRTVGMAIKTVQSDIPRRRSQLLSKPEEGVKEETTAQDGGRVLRERAVLRIPTPKHEYTRHSQTICEELEKEANEVAEGNDISTTEAVEEFFSLSYTEGEEPEEITSIKEDVVAVEELREEEKQQLEDEHLINEEETEKQEEPGVEDTVVKGSSTELPDTAEPALTKENEDEKVTDESETEQNGEETETSVIQDKDEVSGEMEEPPVVQKRALRGRHKGTSKPKPTKQSKRHQKQEEEHTDEAYLGEGGSASEEKAYEQALDKQMEQVEQEETVDKTEKEISTEELTVVEEGISKTEDAAEDVIPLSEVNVEESKEVQEEEETEGETETVSVMEADKEEQADDMIQAPDNVAAAPETVIPDVVLDEAAAPVAEEPQEKVFGSEIPRLQKATVILVDLKTTYHHLGVKETEEIPDDGECATLEKEPLELIAAEDKVSSCVAEEQTPEPDVLVLEEGNVGKQENITEASVDATAEAYIEKEESAKVVDGKTEAEEAPVIEARVLRSGLKTAEANCKSTSRSNQQQAEDNIAEGITEKEVDEAETGTVEVEEEMEGKAKDAITVRIPVEEKQSTDWEICADTKADIPVVDDTEENLPPAEVCEAMSLEEEAPVVETRASQRSGTKTVTATPRHKTERSRKQVDEQEVENGEEEDPAVIMRTLTQGRTTPKGKSRRTHKQIKEEEQKREEESESLEETGVEDEEAVKEAGVEKTDKEIEKQTAMETGERVKEEAASEREESLESKIDLDEEKAVAEEGQEEQSEAISKTFAEREAEASGKECDERKPVMEGEENELPSVAVTRVLRSGETSKAPRKTRSRRSKNQLDNEREEGGVSVEKSADGEPRILRRERKSNCRNPKQLQKEEEGPKESAEEAEVEEEEAGVGSAEKPQTEGDKGKAPEEDKTEVEKKELVTEEVEKGLSGKGTMTITEEEENTAEVTAAADNLVQGETNTALPKSTTDSAILTPYEEEATPSAEVQQSEEMVPQFSDFERVTVVLVDLKKTCDVQEETDSGKEGVPVEKTAAEAEEEQRKETTKMEETMAEEHIPYSPVGIEKTELEKAVVAGFEEKVEDAVTIQDIGEGRAEETAQEDVAKSVDEEEKEPPVTKTRTLSSRKKAVKATPRCKLARSRQKRGEDAGKEGVLAPEEGQASSTESVANKEAEAPVGPSGDEGKTLDDVAEEAVTTQDRVEGRQSTSTSEVLETADGESAQETLLTAKDSEANSVSEEEEAPVIETRVLRSGEKTVRATTRSNTTKRQGDDQEEEATGEKSTEDEPAVETIVQRKGRSAAATPRRKSEKACTQGQKEEWREKETTQAEKMQVEETKANDKEVKGDETIEEKVGEKAAAQKEKNMEPEVEVEKVEAVAEESLTEQETVEEEQFAVSETCADGQEENVVGESAEETHNTDEEESPVGETRVLRSGGKAGKDTLRSKTTKSQQEGNKQKGTVVEQSAETDEPAVETRVLRKGRRSAPATPRRKSKRARTQCLVTTAAEETEREDEEAGQESLEEKGKKPEEEGKSMEIEGKKDKDVEEVKVESTPGGESAVEDAEQMKDASTEEAAVLEKEDNSLATVDETGTNTVEISSAEVEETNSAEEEETTVIEKSTAATEVESDTAIAEEEALIEDASVVAEEEAPAVTTTLRRQTKTSHATPSRRSRRQKDQGVVKTQQQKEENPKDDKRQEVHQLTNDSPENGKLNAKEQAETEETSPSGHKLRPPAEDITEDQAKETAGEEPATEEMQSPEEELSESKEDTLVVEGRSLRRMKTVADKEEDKTEEIQFLKRRLIRKRPRVDYRENDEEYEVGETEAVTDKEEENKVESDEGKDKKKAECSANEPIEQLEESSKENLENNMGAIESTSEKGNVLDLVLDTDEEVEGAGVSQKDKEHEQNMSEEEVEPIVFGKRVLRGRSVPSVIITPQSKSKRHSAKVQIAEKSLSDEEKSPKSAQKRRLRKRKSTEVIPTRKSKRHSRVYVF